MNLVLTWAVLLSGFILTYIILDGFGLGIGILFPIIPKNIPQKHSRDIMMSTVAPIWDGNETWIVLGGAGLYGAFPRACGLLLPALYMPIMIMLAALVFRGVAFEFRFKDDNHQKIWDTAFSMGCIVAALMQGMMLGRFVQGYEPGLLETTRSYSWITLFSVLTGIGVVIGYALLGATWLIMRTEGVLQSQLFKIAKWLLISTVISLAVICLATLLVDTRITIRWFEYRHILWLIPTITFVLAGLAFYGLCQKWEVSPFFLSIGLFVCSYIGFGISLWPYIIPFVLTIWEAAAPESTLKFILVGVMSILPMILIYTSYTYYVFRGKVREKLY